MAGKKQSLTPEEKLARALVPQDQQPYKLPKGWVWTYGKNIFLPMESTKPEGKTFRYIDIESINNEIQTIGEPKVIESSNAPSRASRKLHNGDTIFSLVRPYLKNIAYVNELFEDCIASTGFFVCTAIPNISPKYIYWLMCSPFVVQGLNKYMKGDNSPSIRKSDIESFLFPLPPLPEQQRIVSRIESLFAKLDAARDKLQQVLDTQEARRAAILHEAFTGRLTGHKGSAECRGKREKEGAQNPEGTEFVPEGWKRVKFSDIAEVKSNLVSPQDYQDFPHIAPDNIEKATGRLLSYHTIKEDKVTSPKHRFYPGQILYSKIRPYLSKVVIVDFDGLCSADMYPIETTENTRYLWYYMLSNEFLLQALSGKSRTVLPKINQKELAQIKVLVPPPDEQIVIVEKLDRIFMNEQKNYKIVRYSLSQIDLLKKSILARAFRGQLGTQDPSDPDARDLLTSE
ncbi:restriction endonuclease subunit S [Acidaminococcus timonensis]|uniref:restriction endonuclease subunit S n=1 Tax=Acidaminococcus timonensis TaxID=1871002 RepID=UPI00307994D2